MARKKRLTAEVISDTKQALDMMLRDTPDGHIIDLKKLPEPFRSVLTNMAAVGATFGGKVVIYTKDSRGNYEDKMIVFSPAHQLRRNSRRRSVRRTSRRMAAKRRRTSRT